MTAGSEINGENAIDKVVDHGLKVLPGRTDMEAVIRHYYGHVDPEDLQMRRTEDLFGMVADHLQLGASWKPGTIAIKVVDPKIEIDGWGSEHTVVQIVSDDMPFIVDSVGMELSRLCIGIRLVVHPVMVPDPDSPAGFGPPQPGREPTAEGTEVSFMSIEVDRQGSKDQRHTIDKNIRRVLRDVSAVVRDWRQMRDRMGEVAASLEAPNAAISEAEVDETRELLTWLTQDHFIFLGARDYVIVHQEGAAALQAVTGSGLGILVNPKEAQPRPLANFPPEARERVMEPRLVNLTKASSRSTVHRASYLDYVGVKTFSAEGEVVGERRFLGLFTSEVYHRSVFRIPLIGHTVRQVLDRAAYSPGGHDEKRLTTILERYPRDDLFQMTVAELLEVGAAIAGLQERRRVRVFARREIFGRFVSVLVYLPRDRYNTAARSQIETILLASYGGTIAEWDAQMSDSVLARLRFVLHVDGPIRQVRQRDLESQIEALISVWEDGLADSLVHQFGEVEALRLGREYSEAFTLDYQRAFEPRTAAADIRQIEELGQIEALRINAYREPGHPPGTFKLKLYRCGERVSLTTVMPSLTNLGVTVIDERPYEVRPAGQDPVWVYDFALEHHGNDLDFESAAVLIEEAFAAVWHKRVEDDGFNRLVLRAGMGVADVAVLRAYARYLRQARIEYSASFIERTLDSHPAVAKMLFELFVARFDPDREGSRNTSAIEEKLASAIDEVQSLDQDRVLRRFLNLIMATLRTTWAQRDQSGNRRPYFAVKLDPKAIDELPEPRPMFEIFVFSPRFEGVHLRAGPVARGGLRWSDRSEDYRTEVLGLVKAQMVKNAVIVPAGAKGGFVLKHAPGDPTKLRTEVVTCYTLFISALLDLTDNLVDGEVQCPPRTVRYDEPDHYLVVAADKGTATFSDIANEVAISRGFWLGDAFASGGSVGYDHKVMGITARGAWESVKRHFGELGTHVQSQPFSAVGIGDMSGDVFGNGMLRSRCTRLLAAFDHRHIFVDPDPDSEVAFDERQRLFDLPRSSWDDYDRTLISSGGGVFKRTDKSITLTDQMRSALGAELLIATPDQLIAAVLRAPVDLLWNGGIGTYVKAIDESHAEVGDKANDRIRANGKELRCSVIGEGGNLGVTQRGRIEFAESGGRIFTDAVDNAAGVDCSDHEVNIKILLDAVVANGDMTLKQRNELLHSMTDEVGLLVLETNYRQALALSTARVDAPSLVDVHARYLDQMEAAGLLDRKIEALPDAEAMAERFKAGAGLLTPEIAVLQAYTKNTLKAQLLKSAVPDDEAFVSLLVDYFPSALRDRFETEILTHRLRREIVANRLANLVVDRAGPSMLYRLGQETSAPVTEIAAAHFAAWTLFELESVSEATNSLDGVLDFHRQLGIHLACRQLGERATRLLVRNRPNPFSPLDAIAELGRQVGQTTAGLAEDLVGADREAFEAEVADLTGAGAPAELAVRAAGLSPAVAALDIVSIAAECDVAVREVAATHFAVAESLELTWLRDAILALPRDTQWATLARLTLRTELYADHAKLTSQVITANGAADAAGRTDAWIQQNQLAVDRYRQTMLEIATAPTDVTSLVVAAREVRNLISRTAK